jgi:hypothetical protein
MQSQHPNGPNVSVTTSQSVYDLTNTKDDPFSIAHSPEASQQEKDGPNSCLKPKDTGIDDLDSSLILPFEQYDFKDQSDCQTYNDQIYANGSEKGDYTFCHLDKYGNVRNLSGKAYNEFRTAYASFEPTEDRSQYKYQLWNDTTHNKVISEHRDIFTPTGQERAEVARLRDGTYSMLHKYSMESFLANLAMEYEDTETNPALNHLLVTKFSHIINVFKAGLYRKFCGNKKSFTWMHCNSNYGKTFFFNIPVLTLMVEGSYDRQRIWGDDSTVFSKPLFVFVDEASKFTHEMKSDVYTYRRMYGGTQTIKFGLRVMASANSISDLKDGVDEQLVNRVTKIEPEEAYIEDELKAIGIDDTNIGKRQYEKIIIDILIAELEDLKISGADLSTPIENLCHIRYDEYLSRYSDGLEYVNLEDLVLDEMSDIFQSSFTYNETTESLAFRPQSTCSMKRHLLLKSIKNGPDEIFVPDIHQLQIELGRRIKGRMGAINKKYASKSDLGKIFGQIKQVRLNTLEQLNNKNVVVPCLSNNRPRYVSVFWIFQDHSIKVVSPEEHKILSSTSSIGIDPDFDSDALASEPKPTSTPEAMTSPEVDDSDEAYLAYVPEFIDYNAGIDLGD